MANTFDAHRLEHFAACRGRGDVGEAARFGIDAVPCFVLDRKYAVSGAQDAAVLRQTLQQALSEREDPPDPATSRSPVGTAYDPRDDRG